MANFEKYDFSHTFNSERVMFPKNHCMVGLVKYHCILKKYAHYRIPPKLPFGRVIFSPTLVGLYGQLEHFISNIILSPC
jgi:hypothetical protein